MRVYLDVCCLKHPFDDQGQPRMRVESEAVLALLRAPAEQVELLHAPAQDLENDQNPLAWRDVFLTVDDRVLARARSVGPSIRVRVLDPVILAEEVFP